MQIDDSHYRCGRCGEVKELTAANFYFGKSGSRAGRVTGFCRPCQRAYWAAYYRARSPYQRQRTAARSRDWHRRRAAARRVAA